MPAKSLKTNSGGEILVSDWTDSFTIQKELVLSTEHLSDKAFQELVECSEEGYWKKDRVLSMDPWELTYHSDNPISIRLKAEEILKYSSIGTGFKELDDILYLAIKNECFWVVFREDHPINTNLPIMD